jgi:hypothetical protein|tara:strand:+ start:361 stop:966 length:606 start_codon:yes stop_codon:yes gene_type:complete
MIEGDSKDYNLLTQAAERVSKLESKQPLLTAEIGIRRGLGTKIILEYTRPKDSGLHFHIGIDPYGSLNYPHYDDSEPSVADYDSEMKKEHIKDFADKENYQFINMTDMKFFEKYFTGVLFYNKGAEYHLNTYHLVHFDGPHMTAAVVAETVFFAQRSVVGSVFVFDDWQKYDSQLVKNVAGSFGFEFITKGERKMIMERKK